MGNSTVRWLAVTAAVLALAGCGSPPSTVDGPAADRSTVDSSASAIRLVGRLASPTDVVLSWTAAGAGDAGAGHAAGGEAGRTVEYATGSDAQFVVLQFVSPTQTTFTHPDLIPETTFRYRVRPFYGPASEPVQVDLPPGDYDENAHQNDPDWAAPVTRPEPSAARVSIRATGPAPDSGAPTDVRATVRDANGIAFTWVDHATDEDGYLLEVKPSGATDFSVAAVLDRDVNAYGLVTLPTEKHASYRLRAFYFGPPSNVVDETTGKDSSG